MGSVELAFVRIRHPSGRIDRKIALEDLISEIDALVAEHGSWDAAKASLVDGLERLKYRG